MVMVMSSESDAVQDSQSDSGPNKKPYGLPGASRPAGPSTAVGGIASARVSEQEE